MTMVKLGHVAQCSHSFISKVESGLLLPSIPMLYRLAQALDVKPSSLCEEADQSLGDQIGGRVIDTARDP